MTTPSRIDEILSEMDQDQELAQSLRERILGEEYSSLPAAVAQNQHLIIGLMGRQVELAGATRTSMEAVVSSMEEIGDRTAAALETQNQRLAEVESALSELSEEGQKSQALLAQTQAGVNQLQTVVTEVQGDVKQLQLVATEVQADVRRMDGRLDRGFGANYEATEESTPAELNVILGCLREEILLRILLGGFVQDPAPLSLETGVCIRAGFEGIDLRSAMLAATVGNEQDDMMAAGVFVIIACLNDEEWEIAAMVADVDLGARETMLCRLEEIGGTEGMTAARGGEGEGSLTALLEATTGCESEMEGGTEPAATLVITVAPIPSDIPAYDRSDWRHWIDEDGDCQDARQEVLIAESLVPVIFETDWECRVEGGQWFGAFTAVYVDDPGDLETGPESPDLEMELRQ